MTDLTLCLTRQDPTRNMARFYRMEVLPDLLGGVVLVRNWGRIGRHGQTRQQWFERPSEAQTEMVVSLDQKLRRGYRKAG